MRKGLERLGIAAASATAAFAIAAANGEGSSQGGFVNVGRGQEVRFLGTHVTCVAPKGQIPGGNVGCDVDYTYWRDINHPGPVKYDVSLTLRNCIEVGKWSRTFRLLKTGRVC